MRIFLTTLSFLFATAGLSAAEIPAAKDRPEDTKIEALLTFIGAQASAKFIRNGSEYESATAVKFLRGKWERQRDAVKNARDFIDKIASRSSTTGKPYRIRLADGHEIDCAVFLSNRLAALEAH